MYAGYCQPWRWRPWMTIPRGRRRCRARRSSASRPRRRSPRRRPLPGPVRCTCSRTRARSLPAAAAGKVTPSTHAAAAMAALPGTRSRAARRQHAARPSRRGVRGSPLGDRTPRRGAAAVAGPGVAGGGARDHRRCALGAPGWPIDAAASHRVRGRRRSVLRGRDARPVGRGAFRRALPCRRWCRGGARPAAQRRRPPPWPPRSRQHRSTAVLPSSLRMPRLTPIWTRSLPACAWPRPRLPTRSFAALRRSPRSLRERGPSRLSARRPCRPVCSSCADRLSRSTTAQLEELERAHPGTSVGRQRRRRSPVTAPKQRSTRLAEAASRHRWNADGSRWSRPTGRAIPSLVDARLSVRHCRRTSDRGRPGRRREC